MNLCFVMIVESFEVEHVLFKLILSLINLLLLLNQLSVSTLLGSVILVALVIPSCCRSVIGPVAKAKPAEIMLAEPTLHVVAALVLFDRLMTLRAIFSVGHDPSNVLRFS